MARTACFTIPAGLSLESDLVRRALNLINVEIGRNASSPRFVDGAPDGLQAVAVEVFDD